MAVTRVTMRLVERTQGGATYWDTEVRGFGVRCQRRDVKYVLKYRFKGRLRLFTIGLHGSPWTPDTARAEARRLLGLIHSKENPRDPAADRDRAKGDPTLKIVVAKYLTEYAPAHKKTRTIDEDRRNLEKHVLPVLGKLRVADISQADVASFHAGRSAYPVNANRCLSTLSHVFQIAEKWGYRARGTNPCKGIEKYKETARERLLTAPELARLGDALARATTGWSDAEWDSLPAKERPGRKSPEDYRAVACFSPIGADRRTPLGNSHIAMEMDR
jgi:hypothetical protein